MNHVKSLRSLLPSLGADALLLTSEISQRYATGFPFSDGYVLITDRSAYLLTDFRYAEEAGRSVDPEILVEMPVDFREFLSDLFETEGIRRVGYEDRAMTCAAFRELAERLSFEPIPIGEAIEKLRATKDEEEISLIRRAQEITDRAYSHILSTMTPNMTENDVVLELEFFMRREGAEGIAFPTIAVSGTASALPHGLPSNKRLSRGFLTMDFGARVGGYCSDMTRTVVLGKATPEMRRLYDTVLEAQRLGMAAICEGVPAALVDATARSYINSSGHRGLFGHSFGHGVGLEIHEAPRVSSRSRLPLLTGNVITAEPGIYRMGEYGCRIENMGVVTSNGFDCFTKSSTELFELF
ncbi:MAG: aminopeptidase P family protein [Clostridia bacterium]|nr:aminopeptidase P family protein [Clostridia bacterium]